MRQGPLSLFFSASLFAASLCVITPAHAEETPAAADVSSTVSAEQAQLDSLEQRLAESERQRAELNTQLQSSAEVRENAVIGRLRQENQRLKLQLKEAQASQQPPLLSEEQSWFAIGAAVTLVALLCGALLRGGRKNRRAWIN
jgi:septal ring factor EnvC (AmiA/AmiB activator)